MWGVCCHLPNWPVLQPVFAVCGRWQPLLWVPVHMHPLTEPWISDVHKQQRRIHCLCSRCGEAGLGCDLENLSLDGFTRPVRGGSCQLGYEQMMPQPLLALKTYYRQGRTTALKFRLSLKSCMRQPAHTRCNLFALAADEAVASCRIYTNG